MGYFRVLADGRQGGYWAGVLGRYGPGMAGIYIYIYRDFLRTKLFLNIRV